MSIKRTIITTIVALALVAVVAPVLNVSAVTVADLQAQINALLAQLQGLQGTTSTTTTSGSIPAACVGVTFSRNLKVGAIGSDVECLQAVLNANGFQVSATGAGSPGNETTYFGVKTLVAVKNWQAAAGFVPANQIGPMSRAKLNSMLVGGTSTTTTTTTNSGLVPGCTSTVGYSSTTGASCATGTVPLYNGPVSALLSSDSPVSGAVVTGQASADMLHINFTGTGTVTSVTLQRSGISDQNTLTNVYLFDGNTRITDGYSFNVSGQIVINGLSIAVNGSHVISVRADVASSAVAGQGGTSPASTIAIAMTSYTAGSAMTSSIQGSTMSVVSGSLATVSVGINTVLTATVNAGTTGYTFWSAPIQVNTRAVWLKTASFRIIGSAPSNALANITMFVDGVSTGKVATVMSINGSNYAVFDLTSAPISLLTGSHTVDMRADIQNGTDRNVTVSLQQASDLTVTDPQVGVNIAVSGTPSSGGQINISTGSTTVTVDPTFTAQTNISGGSTNAVIGRFIIHSYGEDVKINNITITPALNNLANTTYTGATTAVSQTLAVASTTGFVSGNAVTNGTVAGTITSIGSGTITVTFASAPASGSGTLTVVSKGLNNVTLYFNGSQIGSQQNWNGTTNLSAFTLGSQMIAPAGQDSILEVRADLQGSNNVAYAAGTVTVAVDSGTSANAQGQSSQQTVFVPGGTAELSISTTGLTIQTGLLAVSSNPGFLAQYISPSTPNTRIGSYLIQNQSTSESIRLTSYSLVTNASGTLGTNDLSALRTSDTTGSGATPIQPSGGSAATSTDTFSVNDTLAPGAQMTLDIFANTGGDTTGTVSTTLNVSSIGSVDNIATVSGIKTGVSLSLGTGTLDTPTIVVSSTTPSQYIASAVPTGAANASQATFSFISTSGASTITELKFGVSGSDATPSQTVTNVCVGSICSAPVAGIADLTGLSLPVPNGGGGLQQNVGVSYSGVGTGGVIPGMGSTLSLTYAKYTTGGATQTISPTVYANMITLVGSKPTVTVAAGGNTGMVLNTSTKVGQVTVTADPKGAIKVNEITFSVGYSGFTGSSPSALTSAFIALGGNNIAITGSSCDHGTLGTITCTLGSGYTSDFVISAGQSQQFDLYLTTTDAANIGTNKAQISTTPTAAGFLWDDASANGTAGEGVALNGNLIYGFPSNAYSVSQ